ncbi:MAG: amidohydrolase family protein [Capsulimonadales bacterium]|nr:amidohydrolase family protein [Capsulimonadales bacterium]
MAEIVFDMHTLFGPVPPRGVETGMPRLIELLKRDGVAGAVTLSTRGLYHSAAAGNRETLEVCRQNQNLFLPAALLDPRQPDVVRTLEGARLLCLMPTAQRWPIAFYPLCEMLTEVMRSGTATARLPLWCQCSRPGDATAFDTLFEKVGLTSVVIFGSIGGEALTEAVSLARRNPRYHIATNGLRGMGEIATAAAAIGADRIVFGSSAPARSLGAALSLVRYSGLTPADRALVFGGNARRLLGGAS